MVYLSVCHKLLRALQLHSCTYILIQLRIVVVYSSSVAAWAFLTYFFTLAKLDSFHGRVEDLATWAPTYPQRHRFELFCLALQKKRVKGGGNPRLPFFYRLRLADSIPVVGIPASIRV